MMNLPDRNALIAAVWYLQSLQSVEDPSFRAEATVEGSGLDEFDFIESISVLLYAGAIKLTVSIDENALDLAKDKWSELYDSEEHKRRQESDTADELARLRALVAKLENARG